MIAVVVFLVLLGVFLALLWLMIEGSASYDEGKRHKRRGSDAYYNTYKGVAAWLYDRGFSWKDKTVDTVTKNAERYNAKNKEKI